MSRISAGGLSFESSAISGDALTVLDFEGEEAISRPFRFHVDLLAAGVAVDLDAITGKDASLTVHGPIGDVTTRGLVTQIEEIQRPADGADALRVTVEPRLSLLDLGRGSRVFRGATVPEIAMAVLAGEGSMVGPDYVEMRLSREHPRRDAAQERESSLAFLSRLFELEGIAYFFEHDGPRERMILVDGEAGLPSIGIAEPGAAVVAIRRASRVAPRGPAGELRGRSVYRGSGASAVIRAGHRLSIGEHPRVELESDLVIGTVRHRWSAERGYENDFEAFAATPAPSAKAVATDAPRAAPSGAFRVPASGVQRGFASQQGGAPGVLREQQHLTKDDDQDARLSALESKDGQQDAKDNTQDSRLGTLESKDAQQDAEDAAQNQKLQGVSTDTLHTWLRFNVPYGEGKSSYLRLGKTPTDSGDIETPLHSKTTLNLNTTDASLDGHFEYTSGNRTIITGGNKEEVIDGKNRLSINGGGMNLWDADPVYFLDYSQDVTGAWRKSEVTHVSATQLALGDTETHFLGVTGSYFAGIKVDAFASLAMTIGFGIKYDYVKGFDFREAQKHDIKARERVTLRVKAQEPFLTSKSKIIIGAGLLAGTATLIAAAAASGRTPGGSAVAALGASPTVGLATAASVAAVMDMIKRYKRKTAEDQKDNDSVVSLTEHHVDINSVQTNLNINGQNDTICATTSDGIVFVMGDLGGGLGRQTYIDDPLRIRLVSASIELHGPVVVNGNLRVNGDLDVTGNVNMPNFQAPPGPPPPPAPPPPPREGVIAWLQSFWA